MSRPTLSTFEFDVVTVDAQGQEISRTRGQAQSFTEALGSGVGLDMVAIPGGTFVMGLPEREVWRFQCEGPRCQVRLNPFCMGRYAVTQAQWVVVSGLPKVSHDLNPDPSIFKGANRPVEKVSWFEAVEFCERLSRRTGRQYRLPSEAEWEYACRAGTTTPYHFGETLTKDLANYDGRETTDVGSFAPNAFGLYDLHGNVWEWCVDSWHDNYQDRPTDGSAWVEGGDSDRRVLRSGSCVNVPTVCRSNYRNGNYRGDRGYTFGFRVVCAAP